MRGPIFRGWQERPRTPHSAVAMMCVTIMLTLIILKLMRIVFPPGRLSPQCRSCFELPDKRIIDEIYLGVKHIFAKSIYSKKFIDEINVCMFSKLFILLPPKKTYRRTSR